MINFVGFQMLLQRLPLSGLLQQFLSGRTFCARAEDSSGSFEGTWNTIQINYVSTSVQRQECTNVAYFREAHDSVSRRLRQQHIHV